MTQNAIHHVAIICSDKDAVLHFYGSNRLYNPRLPYKLFFLCLEHLMK